MCTFVPRMKKNLILSFLMILSVVSSMAQANADTLNRTDAKGKKIGWWKTYYPGNKIKSIGYYKNDLPIGLFRHYYEKGGLRAEMTWLPDGITCDAVIYSEEGKKYASGRYVNKKKHGLWTYFFESGIVGSIEEYDKGKPIGTWKYYYPDGKKILDETSYANGLRQGAWKQFYESGTVKMSATYQRDTLMGRCTYFYPSGKTELTGEFSTKGLKQGIWFRYNERGEILEKIEYRNGKPTGKKAEFTKSFVPIKVNTPDGIKE